MSRVESVMVKLGTEAPAFSLVDVVSERTISGDELFKAHAGAGLLVMFVCVHCPYVKHIEAQLARIGADYAGRIGIAAISSNDIEAYPQDAPSEMKLQAERLGWQFPYLFDPTQDVARSFAAACTPDFFLFDGAHKLAYRGQLDSSRPVRVGDSGIGDSVSGADLRGALDAVIAGREPAKAQRSSLGCNIKWREPAS